MEALITATDRDNEREIMLGNNGIIRIAMHRNTTEISDDGALTSAKRTTVATEISSQDVRLRARWMLRVRGSNEGGSGRWSKRLRQSTAKF